ERRLGPRYSLARPRAPLIGRERELADVCRLLARADVGLLTLTGAGGTGKTRLAVEAAAQLLSAFRDGLCFVDLAPVPDSPPLFSTSAQLLGLREASSSVPEEDVKACLLGKELLLLLDNLEHLLPAAGKVAALLALCPGVKLLVTSRVSLRLREEHDYPVCP